MSGVELAPDGWGLEDAPAEDVLLCGAAPDGEPCRAPAAIHAWPGSPPDVRKDFTVYSCPLHLIRLDLLWDFHAVASGACGIPGARWQSGERQGAGRCIHEIGEGL